MQEQWVLVMQVNTSAADVYAGRILQLTQAFPAQQEAILDSVLDHPSSSRSAHVVPAPRLAQSLQAQLGWSLLLCNSGQAL